MQSLKSSLKFLFQITNTLQLLDTINFKIAKWRNQQSNLQFKKAIQTFRYHQIIIYMKHLGLIINSIKKMGFYVPRK